MGKPLLDFLRNKYENGQHHVLFGPVVAQEQLYMGLYIRFERALRRFTRKATVFWAPYEKKTKGVDISDTAVYPPRDLSDEDLTNPCTSFVVDSAYTPAKEVWNKSYADFASSENVQPEFYQTAFEEFCQSGTGPV